MSMLDVLKKIYTIFWGVPDSWLYAVIALVILDYITGVCAAIHSKVFWIILLACAQLSTMEAYRAR